MSAPAPASAPTHSAVEVNLNVVITADGELQLLSQPIPAPMNVVCATEKLSVTALYDVTSSTKNALIEFWEDGVDEIKAQLAHSKNGAVYNYENYYKRSALKLAQGLQAVLCGEMDANKSVSRKNNAGTDITTVYEAKPFVGAPYGASGAVIADYKIFNHFGRMALACYAHHIMGHQQATAAITNDKAFMAAMLSLTLPSAEADKETLLSTATAAQRYAAYSKKLEVEDAATDVQAWTTSSVLAGSASDADLARRLVGKILDANLEASVAGAERVPKISAVNTGATASSGLVADIVDQVIGRDVSRARDEDNSKYPTEKHGLLRFYADDVIFVNIKLLQPDVKVGTGQIVQDSALEALYPNTAAGQSTENDTNYTIRIVLGA